ncbi:MAG: PKD domain-containing protein, partial [Candidatus Eisenbacteria bacterium]
DGTIVSYRFDFGDGFVVGPQALATATHIYYSPGRWTATVVVTDNAGATGSASVVVTVTSLNLPPVASLTITPSTGVAPLPVVASAAASSDPDGSVASYRFDFGDGTVVGPQSLPTATHVYAAGQWTATVVVADNAGATASASAVVSVSLIGIGVNLVRNPSFETDTTGWAPVGGTTLERVPGGCDGSYSLEIGHKEGQAGFAVTDQPNSVASTAGPGTVYRFSTWIRSDSSGGQSWLRVRESHGSVSRAWVESAPLTLAPSWQRLTLDYGSHEPGSSLEMEIAVITGRSMATRRERLRTRVGPARCSNSRPHGRVPSGCGSSISAGGSSASF